MSDGWLQAFIEKEMKASVQQAVEVMAAQGDNLGMNAAKGVHYMRMTMKHLYDIVTADSKVMRDSTKDEVLQIRTGQMRRGGFIYTYDKKKQEARKPPMIGRGRPSEGKDRYARFNSA